MEEVFGNQDQDGQIDDVLAALSQTNDGLSKAASIFEKMGGRELSPDALRCISFLEANGSADQARRIIRNKLYQLSVSDLAEFTEKLSAATAYREQIKIQGDAFRQRGT